MNTSAPRSNTLSAIILAAGLIITGSIVSYSVLNIARSKETITSTGSAKQQITSDLGILSGSVYATAPTAAEAYRQMKAQLPGLYDYLASQGIKKEDVVLQTSSNEPMYDYGSGGQHFVGYSAMQFFRIESADVAKVQKLSLDLPALVENGINLRVNPPEYYYTKIGDVKIDIQAAAAKDAMERAKRIAEATGRSIGSLSSARMGVLQITPVNSNQTSDWGINDVSSIQKEITAVVNAQFYVE